MQPPANQRRADLAKIHLAKKDLRMSDDDYAAVMLCVSKGRTSSAGELDVRERGQVLEHFKRCGWKPKPRNSGAYSRPVAADSAEARKVRALWLMLHELGQVRDPSERALGSYCKRVLKVDALQWTDGQIWRLIESLKDWAMRVLPARCEAMRQQVDAMGLPPEKTAGVRQAFLEMSGDRLGRRKPRFDHYHALYAALMACVQHPAKETRA